MNIKKIVVLFVAIIAVVAFFVFDLQRYIDKGQFDAWLEQSPILASAGFALFYVLVTALSLPGASAMTLLAGAIFGLWWGLLIVSFASAIGATINMLISRTLLRDYIEKKFSRYVKKVNRGLEQDGPIYLFTLRLIPVVPFFVINPVFGLTQMSVWVFYVVSQIGMLPGTFLYVNAGAQLGQLEEISMSSIFTLDIILAFAALLVFPFAAKYAFKFYEYLKSQYILRKNLKKYKKPDSFDANLVVIGAGSGGLVSAYIAAALNSKVYLIERDKMGGDCLNTGCVPSKAIIKSAKVAYQSRHAAEYGVAVENIKVDFQSVMARVHSAIKTIEPHDSIERYSSLGVNCINGSAEVLSPYEVKVGDEVLRTKNIVVATGGRPAIPDVEGLDDLEYLSSDNLWSLNELPQRLLVVGGGPIGCELSQAFARLGSTVTIVSSGERLLPRSDSFVSEFLEKQFSEEHIVLYLGAELIRVAKSENNHSATIRINGDEKQLPFTHILFAVGREANTEGLGLEKLGIESRENGTLKANDYLQVNFPNMYACGDVVGPYQFTHTASHQAWYAAVNSLFGFARRFSVDYSVIPWVIFTDPEIAHVGKTESELREDDIDFEVTSYAMDGLDRAITEGEIRGEVRVLTAEGSDKILGATIIGAHAGELLTEFVTAMKTKKGLSSILGTIHAYPTWSEANKFTGGQWKRAHAPEKVLNLLRRFHRWQRA